MTTEKGIVIWVTGLSGAGKTSIAEEVHSQLKKHQDNIVLLDGDVVRTLFGNDLGHTPDDRLVNAWRLCRLCWMLSEQGIDVVCATMSLFKECHAWNRDNLYKYYEILIDVPLDVLKERDSRQIYSRAERGELAGVVGVDLNYELPKNPHLVLDNKVPTDTFDTMARKIIGSIPKFKKNYKSMKKEGDGCAPEPEYQS